MALAPLKLPKLQGRVPIVDNRGLPTSTFVRYWNIDFIGAIERSVNDLAQVQADLAQVQSDQAEQLLLIQESQAQIAAQVIQIQALLGLTQGAQQAANDAQQTADEALGTGSVSGSNTNPSVDLVTNGAWVNGPVVNLTSVLAGTLTISGSGPIQDADVDVSGGTTASCEFRIVEVIGGIDTMPAKFSGTFTVDAAGFPAVVTNLSSAAVAAYSSAETSTGAVDYRIDARKVSGAVVTDLALYIYARRAA